jgi:hypothetical protein
MECSAVAMFDIRKDLIPCAWMLGVVYAQEMHDHPLDDPYLSIILRVEGSGFGELDVQQQLEA